MEEEADDEKDEEARGVKTHLGMDLCLVNNTIEDGLATAANAIAIFIHRNPPNG